MFLGFKMKGRTLLLWLCVLMVSLSQVVQAEDIGNTKTCSEVQAFKDRLAEKISTVDTQIADIKTKFPEATPSREQYIADKEAEKALINRRFERIAKANCDVASGYPHLITDGRWSHAGDFIIPSLLWIYLTGALAWAGRDYLMKTRNPMDEILIDLPKALESLGKGLAWFVFIGPEILSGSVRDSKVKP
jgi:photosystem I subunit III